MSSTNSESFHSFTKLSPPSKPPLRNAISASKRRPASTCDGTVRRVFNITPLRFKDMKKNLEEGEKEQLPSSRYVPIPEDEEDDGGGGGGSAATAPNSADGDSFELDLSVLASTTPAKPSSNAASQHYTNNNKVTETPRIKCSVNLMPPNSASSGVIQGRRAFRGTAEDRLKEQQCATLFLNYTTVLKDNTFKKIVVKNQHYVVLNQLGKGGSSEVYRCYCLETKCDRAIKSVSLHDSTTARDYINEVKILKQLQTCDRIIKMFDYEIVASNNNNGTTTTTLLVVLEVAGADMSKILKDLAASNSSHHMPLYMLIYYWMEMLYAIKQVHSHDIIHSDLKPANFLRGETGLKLIDFGISDCIQNDMTSIIKTVPAGSFNYISPEALTNNGSSNENSPSFGKHKYKLSFKSDVWSLGCILYQLVYRRTPFQHVTQMWMKLSTIMNPNHQIDYPPASWVPPKILRTIKSCLQYETKLRPSIDQLIAEYETAFENVLK